MRFSHADTSSRTPEPSVAGDWSMASHILMALVLGLVVYLFFAVINPDEF